VKKRNGTLGGVAFYSGRVEVIVNIRPILSSERMLHKDYNRKCPVGK
jgi:hypothetical protein